MVTQTNTFVILLKLLHCTETKTKTLKTLSQDQSRVLETFLWGFDPCWHDGLKQLLQTCFFCSTIAAEIERQRFSNFLLSGFGAFVTCSLSFLLADWRDLLLPICFTVSHVVQRRSSVNLGCNKSLFELLLPFPQLWPVWLFSSDLWHQRGFVAQIFSLFLCKHWRRFCSRLVVSEIFINHGTSPVWCFVWLIV